ncbi:sensor histidine kinase [Actinacidiphila guanduensis]|uniref:Two-component system, NarL family, sensor histidine kinase DesK n=1 Tax=Actinacidiphila guanduensis TaxID=310781 RepID=A0A1H0J1C8_9ACTN|nr:histidine kinase [Actinacidiphila guanduensis]SDO37588.1 two-component system, NarL family, sensor histidine kinase DesK [Actinacidiphila guanduensis]
MDDATGASAGGGYGPAAQAEGHDNDDNDDRAQRYADVSPPRFALLILCAVLAGFLVQVSVNLYSAGANRTQLITGILCFTGICSIQLLHSLPGGSGPRRRGFAATLGMQALLTFLPIAMLGDTWGAAGGFLAASTLLLIPYPLNWPVFLLVAAANPVIAGLRHNSAPFVVYSATSTLITGLMIYGISRMTWLVSELHRARTQLAAMAVSEERLRFARDLHDLLGYSLSAITLKSEVAIRHIRHRHEQAKEELTSILAISRQALADVRHVARSYRDLSLGTELETCVAMLESAAIEAVAHVAAPLPEGQTSTILATVLREAVTNMLRHSKVQHCVIRLTRNADARIRLSIVNDGTGMEDHEGEFTVPVPQARSDSSGLANLEARLAAVGGTLSAGLRPDGRFEVVAEVPAVVPPPPEQPADGGAPADCPPAQAPGPDGRAGAPAAPRLWLKAASRQPGRCESRRPGSAR